MSYKILIMMRSSLMHTHRLQQMQQSANCLIKEEVFVFSKTSGVA
jgi:hypothetical protein